MAEKAERVGGGKGRKGEKLNVVAYRPNGHEAGFREYHLFCPFCLLVRT